MMNEILTQSQTSPEKDRISSLVRLPVELGARALQGVENYFRWRRSERERFLASYTSGPHKKEGWYINAGDMPSGLDDLP